MRYNINKENFESYRSKEKETENNTENYKVVVPCFDGGVAITSDGNTLVEFGPRNTYSYQMKIEKFVCGWFREYDRYTGKEVY